MSPFGLLGGGVANTFPRMMRRPVTIAAVFAGVLCALVLVRGVALMCVLPPGEGWDEYQHVAYVQELSAGRGAPVLDVTEVDAAVVSAAVSTPMSPAAAAQLQAHGGLTYAEYWQRGMAPVASATAEPVRLYQAQHAPLWYALASPLYDAPGGATNWPASVAALRAMNLALLVLAMGFMLAMVRELWKDHPLAPWTALAMALSPMLLLNSVRAANDGLAVLLTAAALWCLAKAISGRATWVIAGALCAGAAFWSKSTSIALLPFGILCMLLCPDHRTWRARLVLAGLFASIVLATIAPYLLQSHARYGVLVPAQESIRIREAGHGLVAHLHAALAVDWPDRIVSWWTRGTLWIGGWSSIRPAAIWRTLYALLIAGGIVGWIVSMIIPSLRQRSATAVPWRIGVFAILLLACYTLALAAHAVSSKLAWGSVMTNPWYAAPAIPLLLLLVISGWARLLPPRYALAPAIALSAIYLIVELAGLLWWMPMRYALLPLWSGGMSRIESLQPALLNRYLLAIALVLQMLLIAMIARALWRQRRITCD